MELRHLRYFVAVAEDLHFGRAAARLHIAQPPLSQQIRVLEGELGALLFHRTRRKVELTEAGRAFLPEARATLAQAERARSALREAAEGTRGRLAIGFVTSACHTILPAAIRAFRGAYPGVDVTLHEMTPAVQIAALDRREIDLGLLRPPVGYDALATETLLREPLVAALPAGHPLAARNALPLRSLREQPFVLFPRRHGPGLYDTVLEACRAAGFTPRVAHEPDDMQSLLVYVAGGLGVTLVPASLAGFHPGEIAFRPLRGAAPCIALVAAWASPRESAVMRNFRAIAVAEGKHCLARVRTRLTPKGPKGVSPGICARSCPDRA